MPEKQQKKTNVISSNKELKIRYEKLKELRKSGKTFPNNFRRSITADILHINYDNKTNEELKRFNVNVNVAGRIISRRIMGKASFITLKDINGYIQLYIVCDDLGEEFYNQHFKKWDIGDIVGACGILFKTKTGELSIHCSKLQLLTKSLRTLPEKFHGLVNQEIKYRQRYLDLIANHKSCNIFKTRSQILTCIRKFMSNHNFIEVETPMLQIIPGGASARPFITHHNTLDIDMYLRVAPELYLKRLIVGGFDKIFEINRNFRNEGISPYHNPEFTMMELYMSYADYKDLIHLTEILFRTLAKSILGDTLISYGKYQLNFKKPFKQYTMYQSINKFHPEINLSDLNDFNKVKLIAESMNIKIENHWGSGKIITKIFEETVESHLIQPTFITEYPIEVSPLARRNDCNPDLTDRFELFICGHEIGNGFSELNDVEDQAKRFLQQSDCKYINNDEVMFYDEDYITALEYGLPPTAGLGLGIDRIVMLFTNTNSIRDVIFFPTLRPKNT